MLLFILSFFLTLQSPASAQETPVEKNTTGSWGGGHMIGVPLRHNPDKGLIFGTMEMEVSLGTFPGDSRYFGSSYEVSCDTHPVYAEFEKLDRHTVYIFEYKQKKWSDPEIESSDTQIIGIQPVKTGFEKSGLPMEMSITSGRSATYSTNVIISGRIIDVMRWGYWHHVCSVTIEQGGLKASANGTDTNSKTMNVYSEEGCKYAEQLLPYGVEVEMTYDADFNEVWDHNDYVIRKIRVLPESLKIDSFHTPQGTAAAFDSPDYEEFKRRILEDEEFLEALRKKMQR